MFTSALSEWPVVTWTVPPLHSMVNPPASGLPVTLIWNVAVTPLLALVNFGLALQPSVRALAHSSVRNLTPMVVLLLRLTPHCGGDTPPFPRVAKALLRGPRPGRGRPSCGPAR